MNMQAPHGLENKPLSPKKMAQQIIFICERELEVDQAHQKVSELLFSQLNGGRQDYFQALLYTLLEEEESQPYAAHAFASLFSQESLRPELGDFWQDLLQMMIRGHRSGDLPSYRHQDSGKVFSAYAFSLGETLIQMGRLGAHYYDFVSDCYTHLIRAEAEIEKKRREAAAKPHGRDGTKKEAPANPKSLYDDVADYISERAIFRARTLNPNNPNEFIQLLSDRLRSTRRYVIQDLINKDSVNKKKQMEKALKERQASAEELVFGGQPFLEGLRLFKEAKLYNGRFMEAEKRRVTLQLLPLVIAVPLIGFGLMEVWELNYWLMGLAGVVGIGGRFVFTPKFFSRFYPKDITSPLEEQVSLIAAVFKKCAADQLASFLRRQVKEIGDAQELNLIPDYVTYILSVIPRKKDLLLTKAELRQTLDQLAPHIARRRRDLYGQPR